MWICVHDQVFGGKSRRLAAAIGCSQDEAVGLLVRLWVWGLTNCDRFGLVQYADTATIADVLTQGLSKELKPEDIVSALIDCEYLDTCEEDIYIHDWADWQKFWYSYQDRKISNTDSKRRAREIEQQRKAAAPRPAGKEDYSEAFEKWWGIYPRKINKIDAYAKYKTRVKEGYTEELLYEAALKYSGDVRKAHTEKRYMLHPSTFLGPSLRFKDYIVTDAPQEAVYADGEWHNPFEKWREHDE